ncbi:cytochrome c oxidase subunit 2 [Azospirillum baldaniorum]|uniref:cytochrome c oxidase subunit II n=1 Tax=Azospirillum baldaniorum TaxID=1064539 RepID=UPI00119F5129|nr:cytochrome c oxidase subunit II [Azospirillum baldaniorum]TWA69305.1 cytochrome c oxidase subunit 2 [Azospirillum baldaniorum]
MRGPPVPLPRPGRVVPFLVLTACSGPQSMLDPAGGQAARIGVMGWILLAGCAFVYTVVLLWLLWALTRRHRWVEPGGILPCQAGGERRLTNGLAVWVAGTVLILFVFVTASYAVDKSLTHLANREEVVVEVEGKQWWWTVRYPNDDPSRSITTANEIHLPVGVPVRVKLKAADVIHSLWIPNLHGKMDLIPGRDNELFLTADREGTFRGQCAEFCGLQHAHMALDVIVHSRAAFDAWKEAQLAPAPAPTDEAQARGQAMFLTSACTMCHGIRGTPASASVAPDLTHLASRRSIAAGALPYNRGNLAGWIADPQRIKPGNHMPLVGVPPSDLQALVAYLDSLK